MASSFLLGRFEETIQDADGDAQSSVSVEVRRQGATVNMAQSGTSPLTVTVDDRGSIEAGDTVAIDAGTTTYNVDSRTVTTVVLSGFAGTLELTDDQRITPTNNLPSLFNDIRGNEPSNNPLTTGATGQVSAWLAGGSYDRKISGGSVTAELRKDAFVQDRALVLDVTQAPYYAKFNGTTDDTTAIRRALLDALLSNGGNSGGAIVQLPPGVAIISTQLDIGEASGVSNVGRVHLRGSGRRTTILKAAAGFTFNGTTTAMLRIGAGLGANMHSVIASALQLDCNNVASSIGVYSVNCQEGSGLEDVLVANFKVKGIFFDTAGCQNYTLRHVETFHTSTTARGIDLNSNSSINLLSDITTNSNNSTTSTDAGILLTSTSAVLERIHCEYSADGVRFATGSSGLVNGIFGHSTVTDLIQIDVNGVQALSVLQGGATNAINNTVNGNGAFSLGDAGYYITGNDGTGADGKDVLTSSATKESRKAGPFKLLHTLRFNDRVDVASAATLDATTQSGNFWNITGTTPITSITTNADDNGRLLLLHFATGATNIVVDGGNLLLQSSFSAVTGDFLLLMGDGTNWTEMTTRAGAAVEYTARQTIASASTVTLGASTRFVDLTGTTTITKIASAAAYSGRTVSLLCAGSTQFNQGVSGTANDLLNGLGANATFLVNTHIIYRSNGTNWLQV